MIIVSYSDEENLLSWEVVVSERDLDHVISTWYTNDSLLVGLSSTPSFEDKTAWADLSKDNIYTLILHCFSRLELEGADEKIERLDEPFRSMKFLTCVLIRHFALNDVSGFNRINFTKTIFGKLNVKLSLNDTFSLGNIVVKPTFTIVVDNEKDS